MRPLVLTAVAVVSVALSVPAADARPVGYRLDALPGGGVATAVNDLGVAAGQDAAGVAVVWDAAGATAALPGLNSEDPRSTVEDLNDRGDVVGWSYSAFFDMTPVRWDGATHRPTDILVSGESASAHAVNEQGVVVGDAGIFEQQAFVWRPGQEWATVLPALDDRVVAQAAAVDVNARGQAVGYSTVWDATGGRPHPVLWDTATGALHDLGVPRGFVSAEAFGITARGDVVGRAWTASGATRLVWWLGASHRVRLFPATSAGLDVTGVSGSGVVVGTARPSAGTSHAFVWLPHHRSPTWLPERGASGSRAYDVNDSGVVAGWSDGPVLWRPAR